MKAPNPSSSVELKLLGQRIALKSQGEPERVAEVVELASRKIAAAEERLTRAPGSKGAAAVLPQHVALLALLDLAEDFLTARQNVQAFRDAVSVRAEPLLSLIDTERG